MIATYNGPPKTVRVNGSYVSPGESFELDDAARLPVERLWSIDLRDNDDAADDAGETYNEDDE